MDRMPQDKPKSERALGKKLRAVGAAAVLAFGVHANAAGGSNIEDGATNPAIQRAEKALSEQGVPIKITFERSMGTALVIRTLDNRFVIAQKNIGEHDLDKSLRELTNGRAAFEWQAWQDGRSRKIKHTGEKVRQTEVDFTAYGNSLMRYLDVKHEIGTGTLTFANKKTLDITTLSGTEAESVEIRGVQLERLLAACEKLRGGQGGRANQSVYFIGENGETTKGSYEDFLERCR